MRGRGWILGVVSGVVAFAASASACGSRTGLESDLISALPESETPPATSLTCKDGDFALRPSTVEVIFVIDRSGSMSSALPGDTSGRSKWELLRDSLGPMVKSLASKITVGAKFYPEAHDGRFRDPSVACRVDSSVDREPSQSTDLLETFDSTAPAGGTPTADALRSTVDYLAQHEDRSKSRFLILATDGAPNCNGSDTLDSKTCVCTTQDPDGCRTGSSNPYNCLDDARTIAVIEDALDVHFVPTYVIGLGAVDRPEFTSALDRMATAGGRGRDVPPRYYEALNATDLGAALAGIEKNLSACTYVTPSRPDSPDSITVRIGDKVVLRDDTHKSGWDWLDRAYGKIGFFGASCESLTASTAISARVDCDQAGSAAAK